MSHMVKVSGLKVTDLNVLRAAAQKIGALVEDRKAARYWGGTEKCDHTITLPGCGYDIAVHRSTDGTYGLRVDEFGRNGRQLKSLLERLKQEYAVESVRERARRMGWLVHETRNDGVVKLQITTSN